jgi:hypothetical protein
LNWST